MRFLASKPLGLVATPPSNGALLPAWLPVFGTGNLVQGTLGDRPVYTSDGALPTIDFGPGRFMSRAATDLPLGDSPRLMVVVAEKFHVDAGVVAGIAGYGDGTTDLAGFAMAADASVFQLFLGGTTLAASAVPPTDARRALLALHDGTDTILQVADGAAIGPPDPLATTDDPLIVGVVDGSVSALEILIYDAVPSDEDTRQLVAYLTGTYNVLVG